MVSSYGKCVEEIDKWMTSNRLKVNSIKTVYLDGTRQQLAKVQCQIIILSTSTILISAEVTCLRVDLDSELKFYAHIKRLSGRCIYHLRQLRTIRRTITVDVCKTLMDALEPVAVFLHTAAVHVRPLQSVLKVTAKLIIQKRNNDRITPVMRDELHWLSVTHHIIQGMSVRHEMPTSKCIVVSRRNMHPSWESSQPSSSPICCTW